MRAVLATLLLASSSACAATPQTEVAVEPSSPLALDGLTQLDGTPLAASALAGKALVVVNVASKCGYTPQYEGLQALYAQYESRGLVIIGQPSNQFGGQEPGSAEKIADFCKMNFGVSFPLLEKADVNGAERTPLYAQLVASPAGAGKDIRWNFEKFVVSSTGQVVARFGSATKPDDPKLVAAIEAALPKPG